MVHRPKQPLALDPKPKAPKAQTPPRSNCLLSVLNPNPSILGHAQACVNNVCTITEIVSPVTCPGSAPLAGPFNDNACTVVATNANGSTTVLTSKG